MSDLNVLHRLRTLGLLPDALTERLRGAGGRVGPLLDRAVEAWPLDSLASVEALRDQLISAAYFLSQGERESTARKHTFSLIDRAQRERLSRFVASQSVETPEVIDSRVPWERLDSPLRIQLAL